MVKYLSYFNIFNHFMHTITFFAQFNPRLYF